MAEGRASMCYERKYVYSIQLSIVLCLMTTWHVYCTPENPDVTYGMLYKEAKDAYLEERYDACYGLMKKAVEDWNYYHEILVYCRKTCRDRAQSETMPPSVEDLNFYDKTLRQSLCLIDCKRRKLAGRPEDVDQVMDENFATRKPYDYLQICYFKADKVKEAIAHAYTYLMGNPGHEVMTNNLKYYRLLPGVTDDMFKDLEMMEHQKDFILGVQQYESKNYDAMRHSFESALESYLEKLDECRLLCEGPFEQGFPNDFPIALSNHYASVLRCQVGCEERLGRIYDILHPDLLASMYHYLQYAYFQIGDWDNAAKAVASFLVLQPEDEDMLYNKEFYIKEGMREELFHPSETALYIMHRRDYENDLLNFIDVEFPKIYDIPLMTKEGKDRVEYTDDIFWDRPPFPPEAGAGDSSSDKDEVETEEDRQRHVRQAQAVKQYEQAGVHISLTERGLNGSSRFVADGLLSEEECKTLIKMADDGVRVGDGYTVGNPFIHTKSEKFAGMTIDRGLDLAREGKLDPKSLNLFVNLSEKARDFIENYFGLKSHLYFAFTHLVCRTAVEGKKRDERDWLSHPIHGDNCILHADGDCVKERPAFTWRDYSGLLYLSGDFEGGEFIFANKKQQVLAQVKPKCGRLVSFSSGGENLHGVRAVTKGRRCALGMWFTLDPDHREANREDIIDDLRTLLGADEFAKVSLPNARMEL